MGSSESQEIKEKRKDLNKQLKESADKVIAFCKDHPDYAVKFRQQYDDLVKRNHAVMNEIDILRLGIKGEISKSTIQGKKFMIVRPDGTTVHFGDSSMEDYLDHNDKARRKSYLARAKGIKNGSGQFTYKDPSSANYYSVHLLW
jgi:hypothetical protein